MMIWCDGHTIIITNYPMFCGLDTHPPEPDSDGFSVSPKFNILQKLYRLSDNQEAWFICLKSMILRYLLMRVGGGAEMANLISES